MDPTQDSAAAPDEPKNTYRHEDRPIPEDPSQEPHYRYYRDKYREAFAEASGETVDMMRTHEPADASYWTRLRHRAMMDAIAEWDERKWPPQMVDVRLPANVLPDLISTLIWDLRTAACDACRGAPNEEQAIADRLRVAIRDALSHAREGKL